MLRINRISVTGYKSIREVQDLAFSQINVVIGANGAGKSTFLKILSGEIDSTEGEVISAPNKRMSFLKQDHFAYEEVRVTEIFASIVLISTFTV